MIEVLGIKHSRSLVLVIALALASLSSVAQAQFLGYYMVTPPDPARYHAYPGSKYGNWTCDVSQSNIFVQPWVDTSNAPNSIVLDTDSPVSDDQSAHISMSFWIVVRQSGYFSYDYKSVLGNTYNDSTGFPAGSGSVKNVYRKAGEYLSFSLSAGPQELLISPPIPSRATLTLSNVSFSRKPKP